MLQKIEGLKEISSNMNVLVVEDNKELNSELVDLLKLFFNSVYFAYDGEEGLGLYKNTDNIDLVISDINMPKMDGLEMIRHIKYINKDQNCLVLSAYSDLKYVLQIVELGVNQFIPKPYEINDFLNKIIKIIEVIRLRQKNEEKTQEIIKLNSTLIEANKKLELKTQESIALAKTLENYIYNPDFDQKKFLENVNVKKSRSCVNKTECTDDNLVEMWL